MFKTAFLSIMLFSTPCTIAAATDTQSIKTQQNVPHDYEQQIDEIFSEYQTSSIDPEICKRACDAAYYTAVTVCRGIPNNNDRYQCISRATNIYS
ncbi:hypothetical protein Q1W73_15150 [Asticcacaulis sp. ZE23SCel15]|uniref:hypothetical protein n=1 Tax=Asticcacaulis sp. ZE23SCel15 TaxID=3059027 RepID=UPI00265DBECC|nr:hypothetical protein [Asticcacaulis sp. ZE23SCel15]WKL56982.1 hypothetical protein Q1W73_15150 [Asticcacaulis sp. ZE23SCel15]